MSATTVRTRNGYSSRLDDSPGKLALAASIVGKTVAIGTFAVGIAQLAARREEATRAIRRIAGRKRARLRRQRMRRAAIATGVLAAIAAVPFVLRHRTNDVNPFREDMRPGL